MIFLKEKVKTYQIAPMSYRNSPTFFCLHIGSLWDLLTSPYKPSCRLCGTSNSASKAWGFGSPYANACAFCPALCFGS
jgi:hypothetical protein